MLFEAARDIQNRIKKTNYDLKSGWKRPSHPYESLKTIFSIENGVASLYWLICRVCAIKISLMVSAAAAIVYCYLRVNAQWAGPGHFTSNYF